MNELLEAYELGPWLGGNWDWGLRAGTERGGAQRDVLIATTAPHQDSIEALGERFSPGASVLAIGTHEVEHHRVDVLVELRPTGHASTDVTLGRNAALQLLGAAARQLESLHASGFVIASLRPELIYVDDRGRLTGIAPFSEMFYRRIASQSVGSRYPFEELYMAPELVRMTEIGPAADVFSLAACYVRWSLGRYPIAGETFMDRVIALAEARLADGVDLEGLPDHVRRALSSDPMARPPLSAFA